MATYVALPRGYKQPGKLIRVFTGADGVEYVEIHWVKYQYKGKYPQNIFRKVDCEIIRKPTGREKKIRDFFRKLFSLE